MRSVFRPAFAEPVEKNIARRRLSGLLPARSRILIPFVRRDMSSYFLVFDPTRNYNPDSRFKFKYRYDATDGSPVAEPVFQEYCRKGTFVMMWRWDTEAGPPVLMGVCNKDKAI